MAKAKVASVPLGQNEVTAEALPDDLARLQMESPERESDPKVVPLVREYESDGRTPRDAPPAPPVARPSPVPRLIHQNERAPSGLRRYKIRALDMGDQPTRYVLAADEASARDHYLKTTGLKAVLAALGDDAPKVRLNVRPQPD